MAIYTDAELSELGLRHFGKNVKLSTKASIYGAEHISIGDNARIDDFVVLSAGPGGISIGRNVHIGVMCAANREERGSLWPISPSISGSRFNLLVIRRFSRRIHDEPNSSRRVYRRNRFARKYWKTRARRYRSSLATRL